MRWALAAIALASCNETTQPKGVPGEEKPRAKASGLSKPPPSPPTPKPVLSLSCTTDTDCTVSSLEDDCCFHCGNHALNKNSLAALEAYCTGKGADCPAIDCPFQPLKPVCRKGTCIGIIK